MSLQLSDIKAALNNNDFEQVVHHLAELDTGDSTASSEPLKYAIKDAAECLGLVIDIIRAEIKVMV